HIVKRADLDQYLRQLVQRWDPHYNTILVLHDHDTEPKMFKDVSILVSIHLTPANGLLYVVEFSVNTELILSSLGSGSGYYYSIDRFEYFGEGLGTHRTLETQDLVSAHPKLPPKNNPNDKRGLETCADLILKPEISALQFYKLPDVLSASGTLAMQLYGSKNDLILDELLLG
ncbi:hypothetical protein NA56DRAFT_715996, partial [Hyaloscypha hepaticicola]